MGVGTTRLASSTSVFLNAIDISTDINQVDLNFSQAEIDVSTFGTLGWKKKIVSISDGTIDYTGFGEKTGHTLDAQLFSMLGAPANAIAWGIDVPSSGVGDIRYTGNGFLKSYKSTLKVSDAYKLTASLSITGAPTRATITS